MVHALLEQTEKVTHLTLPFSVPSKDRTLPFTKEMEMAAVFYNTESDRKKGEGIILKKQPEELVFIAESHYPLWLVPFNGRTLVFDGLAVSRHIMTYEILPDTKTFINQIRGTGEKRQAYLASLKDHAHYFESSKNTEAHTVSGLMTDPDFLEDFHDYLITAEETKEAELKQESYMHPIVDQTTIFAALNELREIKTALEVDVQVLRDAMKLLSITTRAHVNTLQGETKRIQAELNEKIAEAKSVAMKRIDQIQEAYDARIARTSARFEKELQRLCQERTRLEMKQERALEQIDRCRSEVLTSKSHRDTRGERRWKEEKEKWKRESDALKRNIGSVSKQIDEIESQKNIEVANLRAEFNSHSEEAMKDVRELEATKESMIKINQQEMKTLEDSASSILAQLEKLHRQKHIALEELDNLGMREQRKKFVLGRLPFYIVCFKAGTQRRYAVYSPCVAGNMKTLTRFKSIWGVSKVKSLFQPRSKALNGFLNQMIAATERDPVFMRELHEAGMGGSILRTVDSREKIRRGLEGLRNEEWISASDIQALGTLLKTF